MRKEWETLRIELAKRWMRGKNVVRSHDLRPQPRRTLLAEWRRSKPKFCEMVREAREFAEKSPYPDAASATMHVYSAECAASTPESATIRPAAPSPPREISFTQATVEALAGEMARNPKIFRDG